MNTLKIVVTLMVCTLSFTLLAEEKREVIYQYKKYEKFDLGALEVDGELMTGGDISVRERERERFHLDLFIRRHSKDLSKKDMDTIR